MKRIKEFIENVGVCVSYLTYIFFDLGIVAVPEYSDGKCA